jgi:hypothetical protein
VRRYSIIAGIALCLFAALACPARSQGYAGFRAGVNIASFTGDGVFPDPFDDQVSYAFPDPRIGFTGAAFIGVDRGRYGFRTDIMYTMKGGKEGENMIKVDYLELAPLFVVRQTLSERYALRGFIGPVAGLWVNAEFDNGPTDLDIGDIVNHLDLSATIGAELDIRTGPYTVIFDGRYTYGSRVFKEEALDGSPLECWLHNTGIALSAGLMVPF